MTDNTQKPVENSWLWLVKMVTGPLLLVLLFIHLVVNHYLGTKGLMSYADVIAYYRQPIIPIMEIAFLATVVTHSLSGLRGILLDLKPAPGLQKAIDAALLILGVGAVVYGTWLAITIASKGG